MARSAEPAQSVPGRTASGTAPATPLIATPPALAGLLLATAAVWWAAPRIAFRLNRMLPGAATVRSRGSPFPPLGKALPFELRTGILALLAAALVAWIAPRVRGRVRWSSRLSWLSFAVVVLAAGAIYGWFGYPHNAFLANSEIHWVNIYFNRAHDWWYTLVKLHRFFYNAPYALQALNGALNVALVYGIGRALFGSRRALPVVMALTYLGSSLMLAFANTAEDVQLNVAVLLLAFFLYLRRSTPGLGIALFLLVLGRPQLGYLWAVVVLTEFLLRAPEPGVGRVRATIRDRFLVVNLAVALGAFAVWDLFLVARGENWLLHNGHLLDAGLSSIKPLTTDGFTISPFSGAYVLHGLWIYPLFILIAAGFALWHVRELPLVAKRALVFALLAGGTGLLISESQPLFYFNVRYLSYLFPFFMIAAFTALAVPERSRSLLGKPALAALLCLAALTTHWQAFDERRIMLANPIVRAFPERGEIKALIGPAPVATTSSKQGVVYYISYLLRRPFDQVHMIGAHATSFHGYVFTTGKTRPPGAKVVWKSGPQLLLKAG